MSFVAHFHTPHDCCVRFASAVTDGRATLTARRPATALPGPDFHRLGRGSLTWHHGPCTPKSLNPTSIMVSLRVPRRLHDLIPAAVELPVFASPRAGP